MAVQVICVITFTYLTLGLQFFYLLGYMNNVLLNLNGNIICIIDSGVLNCFDK